MVPRYIEKFSQIIILNFKLYGLIGDPDIPPVDPYGPYMKPYGQSIDPDDLFKIKWSRLWIRFVSNVYYFIMILLNFLKLSDHNQCQLQRIII